MNGDPENRSESGSEEEEHRHRQLANGIKNQRITKAQDRILNRMAKFTKRMPLAMTGGRGVIHGELLTRTANLAGTSISEVPGTASLFLFSTPNSELEESYSLAPRPWRTRLWPDYLQSNRSIRRLLIIQRYESRESLL